TEATRIIEVSNTSQFNAPVEFLPNANIEICGQANISAFCLVEPTSDFENNNETFPLGSGETRRLEIRFKPTVANAQERSSFTLRYCDLGDACEIDISATGFSVERAFSCKPQALNFGAVSPGASAHALITCSATTNQQVTITSARIGGNSSPDFTQDPPIRGTTLHPPTNGNPGASVAIPVSYMPETLGEDAGVLIVETDNADPIRGRIEVPLQGSAGGPNILVQPAQVNFGLTSLLAPSQRTILVSNHGLEDLEVDIELGPGGLGVFSSADLGFDVVAPGEHKVVELRFQPAAAQVYEALLILRSNDRSSEEVAVRLRGEGIDLDPCVFELGPAALDFGAQTVARDYERGFEIRNLSDQTRCVVTSLTLAAESDEQFELAEGELTQVFIEPGSSLAVSAVFAPVRTGPAAGSVELWISSPQSPFITVGLSGVGVERSGLLVRDLDFGVVPPGCGAEARTLSIYNESSVPFAVGSIELSPDSDGFTILERPTLPVRIPSNGRLQVDVGFDPGRGPASDFAGGLEIRGEPGQPPVRVVSLQGSTRPDGVQRDEFEQLARPKVDILFVVDDSRSMADDQEALGENFDSFIMFAEAQALGYHIGAIATNRFFGNGLLRPLFDDAVKRIVTPQSQPSPRQVFLDNVDVGTMGTRSVPLQAAYNALRPPLLDGHNAGFLRRDAALSIIAVTDGTDLSAQSTDFYLDAFQTIKGYRNRQLFSFSAISGDQGCPSTVPSPRLETLVQASGGVRERICTQDWSRTLEKLSRSALGLSSRFTLTKAPVPETLQVYIDDQLLVAVEDSGEVNWTFDEEQLAIDFRPLSVPRAGVHVRIEYASAACEEDG
ncbi:MAG: choice-of-anchor D domain-containing protein, partial [Myxococcota bacterium]